VPSPTFTWHEVTIDCTAPEVVARFWASLLGGDLVVPLPGWLRLRTPGGLPVLNFQPVPEPKNGKTRIHLDLTVDNIDWGVETVTRLGGSYLDERHEYDEGVVLVMADPEGNEFCLVEYFGHSPTSGTRDSL
jgi:Glyoxalase-like domain